MPKQPDYLFIVTDIYSGAVLKATADEGEAWQAVDNTPAYCLIHKVRAEQLERETA